MGTTKTLRTMGLWIGAALAIATAAAAQDAGRGTHRPILLAQWGGGECVSECRDEGSRCSEACDPDGERAFEVTGAREPQHAFQDCQRQCVKEYQHCKNSCRY